MHRSTLTEDRLAASLAACWLYVDRGTTRLTIAELASAIGIAPRTFSRYFPTKADTVVPLLERNQQILNAVLNEPAPLPRERMLQGGFLAMFGGDREPLTRGLFPLAFDDPGMWAAVLRSVHDGELELAVRLAPHLGVAAGAPRARAAAAAVTSASRIGLEYMVAKGWDPVAGFSMIIDAYGTDLFRYEPSTSAPM